MAYGHTHTHPPRRIHKHITVNQRIKCDYMPMKMDIIWMRVCVCIHIKWKICMNRLVKNGVVSGMSMIHYADTYSHNSELKQPKRSREKKKKKIRNIFLIVPFFPLFIFHATIFHFAYAEQKNSAKLADNRTSSGYTCIGACVRAVATNNS